MPSKGSVHVQQTVKRLCSSIPDKWKEMNIALYVHLPSMTLMLRTKGVVVTRTC